MSVSSVGANQWASLASKSGFSFNTSVSVKFRGLVFVLPWCSVGEASEVMLMAVK